MPRVYRVFLTLVLLLTAIPVVSLAWKGTGARVTVMQQVTPSEARPGDIVLVTGYALEPERVREVYLTDGASDYRVEILEQCDTAIRFRVPERIPPGQMRLTARIAGYSALLDQPVFLKILDPVG